MALWVQIKGCRARALLILKKVNTPMSRSATPQDVCPNTETAANHGAPQRHSPGNVTTLLPDRLPAEQVRVSMNRVIGAWAFGAAFFNVSAGAVYVAFARKIGANDQVFGILAAALPLMSFLQVISARLVERSGQRKRQMLTTGIIGRSLWIPAAMTPIIAQGTNGPLSHWLNGHGVFGSTRVLDVVVACILISSAFQAFTSPPFFSWMADLIPNRVRPTFMARRMQVGTFVALFCVLGSGWIADNYPNVTVYGVLLALAAVCGVIDVALFFGVKEPACEAQFRKTKPEEVAPLPPFWASLREPLREPVIRNFLIYVSLLFFAYGSFAPFAWLHMREVLTYDNVTMGVVLNVAPMIGVLLTSRFWGGVIKKYGNRPVVRMGSFALIFIPIVWLTAGANSTPVLFVFLFMSGVFFCALELTNQNLMVGLARHIPRSTITALFAICAGTSFALASCLGGRIALYLEGWRYEILGLTMVKYHVVFLMSLLVRIVNSVFVAPHMQEPEAVSTLAAVKEIGNELKGKSQDIVQFVPEMAQSVAARITRPFGIRDD
jgi:MFS family permease